MRRTVNRKAHDGESKTKRKLPKHVIPDRHMIANELVAEIWNLEAARVLHGRESFSHADEKFHKTFFPDWRLRVHTTRADNARSAYQFTLVRSEVGYLSFSPLSQEFEAIPPTKPPSRSSREFFVF